MSGRAGERRARPRAPAREGSPSRRDGVSRVERVSVGLALTATKPLLGVLDRARLAYDRHLDLTRVLERFLDLLRDVAREPRGREVIDLLGLHDDADLATRLDRERLLDALEAVRDALELLQTLQVVRDDLAAGARARRADRVGRGDERAHHRHRLDVAVMTDDPIDHVLRESVALQKLAADDRVRPLDLVIDGFADVVQQTGALHRLWVVAGLGCEHAGDVRHLDRMPQDVLAV